MSSTPEDGRAVGGLWLVATPIGNLEDITLRALRVLRAATVIAAEDTRSTHKLLTRYAIRGKRMLSHHQGNERTSVEGLIRLVESGESVAYVTDAGTPGVSDPGFLLAREAVRRGIRPVVVPGASALTFAASASGLPVESFAFLGFLPPKGEKRKTALRKAADGARTVFVYESPLRLSKLLDEVVEVFGPDAAVSVVREATKLHEEVFSGSSAVVRDEFAKRQARGEVVVGVCPDYVFPSLGVPPS